MPHRLLILASDDKTALHARNTITGRYGNLFSNCKEEPVLNTEEIHGLVYPWEIARSIILDFKDNAKMSFSRAQSVSEDIVQHLEKKGISVETRIPTRSNIVDGQRYFIQGLIIR